MNLDELEKAANAATNGNWTPFVKGNTVAILLKNDAQDSVINWPGFDSSDRSLREQKANAKFIALAQPSVIIELVKKIKKLEMKVEGRI